MVHFIGLIYVRKSNLTFLCNQQLKHFNKEHQQTLLLVEKMNHLPQQENNDTVPWETAVSLVVI